VSAAVRSSALIILLGTQYRYNGGVDVEELLAKAWKAVDQAKVPDALREVAFKEAVDYLRSAAEQPGARLRGASPRRRQSGGPDTQASSEPTVPRDEDGFFAELAKESGETELDLRDVLHLTSDGRVQVTPPTKDLGKSVAEQAKTVIALVAGARSKGLGERPVDADAVRREVERKHCYQSNNFASKHLRALKGFNAGSSSREITVTSKWLGDFRTALAKAHGRPPATAEE
jgi:hypothetical protein